MKNTIQYAITFLALAMILTSCDDTLDKSFTPEDQISFINIKSPDVQNDDPNDDSGLDAEFSAFVGSEVTFSSSTSDELVAERVWFIPQPEAGDSSLAFEEITEMAPVSRTFARANNPSVDVESRGFPITLTETLTNGDINRFQTQLQIRNPVSAGILAPGVATVNVGTSVSSVDATAMGLSSSDLNGDGQLILEWDFGNGFIETESGRVNSITTNSVDDNFNVIFNTPTPLNSDGEIITLTVSRVFPLRSTSTVQKTILIVDGLTPNRGEGKDAVKLSADGNRITIGYEEAIGDISVLNVTDFELNIVADEITNSDAKTAFEAITITNIEIDPDNANNLLLTLSASIPSILMDNVSLSFNSRLLLSQSGEKISLLLNSNVAQTGENLMAAINASGFEDATTWADGGFFWPKPENSPEITFSNEQSLEGGNSFLFQTTGTDLATVPNNSAIGPNIIENDPLTLPVDTPAQYLLSMWVYVESTEPATNITYFLLDFANFSTDADASTLPVGQWVKVSGVRTINPGGNTSSLIRIVNENSSSNSKIFVDQVEIRIVDDGR